MTIEELLARCELVRASEKRLTECQPFSCGENDLDEFIRQHPHPQYNKYHDPDLFRTFVIDDGNVVWGEDWDLIFPIENLYIGKAA